MSGTTDVYPVLPLRDMVMFPSMIVPLFVGRDKSLKALEAASREGKLLLLAQRDATKDDPKSADLYRVGVVVKILQVLKMQDATVKVLVEGLERVSVSKFAHEGPIIYAYTKPLADSSAREDKETKALRRAISEQFDRYSSLNTKISNDVVVGVNQIAEADRFCDAVSGHLILKVEDKQAILESTVLKQKLEKLLMSLQSEIEVLETEIRLRDKVRDKIEANQKQYYLNAKLKAIQDELGEGDFQEEISVLAEKLGRRKLPPEARERVDSELRKLRTMNPISSEAGVSRNYLEWFADLPWTERSSEKKSLKGAETVLAKDHYGLLKVKERILEYLAVTLRTNSLKSPIICFIGPPGVGKTSLARSIAEATGRRFVKISLGGLRDEAEIKGHRKTYIGAMPGKIIQSMKKAKMVNPVVLLDEIDKMSSDFRGDPASAMLDVLDPEQNDKFNDHYLEVDYNLSSVMFIATANSYDIPRPLLDRMEVIRLPGYTDNEKLQIALNYLLPKQMKAHGLKDGELIVGDGVIDEIIAHYTREAGVRNLDREIAKLARKAVKELLLKKRESITITKAELAKYLGVPRYSHAVLERDDLVGMANGLAYTEVGGEMLVIESIAAYGKGEIRITGKLGDVMRESVYAAVGYIRSKATELGIKPSLFGQRDLHIHVPEGATPKDGPSAGITICTSLVSVLTGIPVQRDLAMTGEITLRGRVLEIGGLKEKLLAALRSGVKTVLIPKDNAKDLDEIEDDIKKPLEIIPVETVLEVLAIALTKKPEPISWSEPADSVPPSEDRKETVSTH
ncbi:MAG: endopeptidase La [Proteobacteria bacterium]|nr:endopeptidase La [Pseudomonadota bacterium]